MWYSDQLGDAEKDEFALRAWMETEAIETALNSHSCDIESTLGGWRVQLLLDAWAYFSRDVAFSVLGSGIVV